MIANFFSKTKPVNIFNVVVLLYVYYFISTFLKSVDGLTTPLLIKRMGFFFWHILLLLIFNFITKKNNLTKDNSYGLLMVVLLLGTFSEAMFSNYIVFSNILLLLSYRKIYSLRSGLNTKSKLFDAGFYIGAATLLYSWSILYLLLIYIGIFMYQKGGLKNMVRPIIGFATPIFLFFTFYFYNNNLDGFYSRFNYENSMSFEAYQPLKLLIPILFLSFILLWAIFTVTPKIVTIRNNFKLSWNVLINHLLISVVIIALSPVKDGSEVFFLIFPSAVIITNFLQKSKSSIFKNVILYLFLIISMSVYFL